MKVVVAFVIFGSLNLFLNFFNKWALNPRGAGFHFAFFYSMFHMAMSALGSLVLMLIRPPKTGLPTWSQFLEYKYELGALALCTSVNIGCNNASLIIIGLFINQIIKALSPFIVMLISVFILGRTYSTKLIVSVVVIAAAAMCAVPFSDPSCSVLGIALVGAATLASSTKPVVGELLMKDSAKPALEPSLLVFYDSCISFFAMMTYWLLVPSEREGSLAYLAAKPVLSLVIIGAGSLSAFVYNLSIYYFTLVASALTVMVATNLLKVCLIATSAVIEGVTDVFNWMGIVVFFAAVCAYAWFNFEEKQQKARRRMEEEATKDGGAHTPPPTEATPLKV